MSEGCEPEKPRQSDCCGSGCTPCVFDIYDQQLQLWQKDRLAATSAHNRVDLLSNTRFKPFRLIDKCQVTDDVFTFRFQPLLDRANTGQEQDIIGVLPYTVGQHLILRCLMKENESKRNQDEFFEYTHDSDVLESKNFQMITRAYTPITVASQEKNCIFEVFVKLYKNGKLSQYLKKCIVGDILHWRGPYGQFKYEPNLYSHVLMICIGSGLAPMISFARSVLLNETDDTVLYLMYGIKNINHIILRKDLNDMTHFWNFTLEYFFSVKHDLNCELKFGEHAKNKRIDKMSINEYIIGKKIRHLLILLCGTDRFVSEINQVILELNFICKYTIFSF